MIEDPEPLALWERCPLILECQHVAAARGPPVMGPGWAGKRGDHSPLLQFGLQPETGFGPCGREKIKVAE